MNAMHTRLTGSNLPKCLSVRTGCTVNLHTFKQRDFSQVGRVDAKNSTFRTHTAETSWSSILRNGKGLERTFRFSAFGQSSCACKRALRDKLATDTMRWAHR